MLVCFLLEENGPTPAHQPFTRTQERPRLGPSRWGGDRSGRGCTPRGGPLPDLQQHLRATAQLLPEH